MLCLLARGLSNGEIASELFLADTTVKSHTARALSKLALLDHVQTVVFAYQTGLVRPGEPEPPLPLEQVGPGPPRQGAQAESNAQNTLRCT